MLIVASLGLLFFLWKDIRLMKSVDAAAYRECFAPLLSVPRLAVLGALMVVLSVLTAKENSLLFTAVLIVAPYLSCRGCFEKRIFAPAQGEAGIRTREPFDALGVCLYWIFFLVVGESLIHHAFLLVEMPDKTLVEMLVLAVVSFYVVLGLVKKASLSLEGRDFYERLSLVKTPAWGKAFLLSVLTGIFFASLSVGIILARPVQPSTPLSGILQSVQSPGLLVLFLALAMFLAPYIEELVFRGYFFKVLCVTKGRRFAIYAVSLSFAFLHVSQYWGDWTAIFMILVLGYVLTMIRAWSRSALASMAAHYAYNIGLVLIPVILFFSSSGAIQKP